MLQANVESGVAGWGGAELDRAIVKKSAEEELVTKRVLEATNSPNAACVLRNQDDGVNAVRRFEEGL